jgi:hypothetical protein
MKPKNIIALFTAITLGSLSGLRADDKHEHGPKQAGPNGGRVLHEVEPHLEFFVTKDRKVQLTNLDDNFKAIALAGQTVTVTAGERSNPIKMTFTKQGETLISDVAFPEGNGFPVVVQIKGKGEDKTIIEKFTMDFAKCPTCAYLEYACTCDHGDEKK